MDTRVIGLGPPDDLGTGTHVVGVASVGCSSRSISWASMSFELGMGYGRDRRALSGSPGDPERPSL
ncbi:hypothetical protein JB92DRAFT_3127868 [Gautieria morchelliformis]|nr:hypothetical protein JB92DRAFT_3127868 [Gautieria morchelliformis]